jgi:hypothetical protein
VGLRGELSDGREALLVHVRDNAVGLAGTVVVGGNTVAEHLEGGVAVNVVLLANILLNSAVDLGKLDAGLLEDGGGLLVLRSKAVG